MKRPRSTNRKRARSNPPARHAVEVLHQYTLGDIRGILTSEIERLRAGSTTPANVNAMSNASGKILSSVKLELEIMKLTGQTPKNIAGVLTEGHSTTESITDSKSTH